MGAYVVTRPPAHVRSHLHPSRSFRPAWRELLRSTVSATSRRARRAVDFGRRLARGPREPVRLIAGARPLVPSAQRPPAPHPGHQAALCTRGLGSSGPHARVGPRSVCACAVPPSPARGCRSLCPAAVLAPLPASDLRPPRSPSLAGAHLNQTAASPAPPDAPCLLPRGHPARRGGPTPGVTPEAPPPGAGTLGTGASVGDPMGTQTHSPRHAPTANPGGAFPAEGVRPSRSLSGLRPLMSPFPSPRGTRHGICDDL